MKIRKAFFTKLMLPLAVVLLVVPINAQAEESDATVILKAMSDYVGSQQTIKLTFDSDIEIIKMAIELSKYGIHIKHLKLFENFAVRHASFIQQIIMPLMISSKKEQHRKGKKVALLLERRLCDLHELLLKKENRKFLEKYK